MNLRSSITDPLVGSDIATVSVRPSRFSGSTVCLTATSAGTSFTMRSSTSKRERSTAGIRYWRASILVISVSSTNPSFTSVYPKRLPVPFCSDSACCSCSRVIRPSRTSRSPSRSVPVAAVAIAALIKEVELRLLPNAPKGVSYGRSNKCQGTTASALRRSSVATPIPRTRARSSSLR